MVASYETVLDRFRPHATGNHGLRGSLPVGYYRQTDTVTNRQPQNGD